MNKGRKLKRIIAVIAVILVVVLVSTVVMMKIMIPGISFITTASFDSVTTSADKFSYQPEKIETGTVYHYVKSNIDGSKPGDVAVYVGSDDHLEVFKIYPGSSKTFFVTADFDWDIFCPKDLKGYEIGRDMEKKLVAHGKWSKENDTFVYSDSQGEYSVPIGQYPVHNFNFDFTGLNFSFRHLTNPESSFEIGVHYPTFNIFTFIKVVYSGKATISYISDEQYHQKPCRKYEISGQGIGNKKGDIWVNKDGGYIENMEIPASDNPGWKTFKMELTGIEKMSGNQWNKYITDKTTDYFADKK